MADLTTRVAVDYSSSGSAWERGAAPIYDSLARVVVSGTPTDWRGRLVVDVGAGTGAASRAVRRAGGRAVATDIALGMLARGTGSSAAAVADGRALPVPDHALDGWIAAFCLNHLHDPERALVEAARVVRSGGPIVASAYAHDDTHPAKQVVDATATEVGWRRPDWATEVRTRTIPRLHDVEAAAAVARAAGLRDATVEHVAVAFPDMGPADLVAWRLALAPMAPFVARLTPGARDRLVATATARLEGAPPLVRRIIVLRASSPTSAR